MDVKASDDFYALAKRLDHADERELRNRVRARLRRVARPIGERMRDEGAAAMPRRGGLSARIASARVGVQQNTSRNPRIVVTLATREGYDLPALDRGQLRHPVFGHRPWVRQTVPAQRFSRAFDQALPLVRAELHREIDAILDEIGRK